MKLMDVNKYVKLQDVKEIIELIELRDCFKSSSDAYSDLNKRIKELITKLEHDAIRI